MKTTDLKELASIQIPKQKKKVKLVISDIEGCLNLDEKTYDFSALSWIRAANEMARYDNPIPLITVCSGRQHAFVEAMVRIIGGRVPALFENGCGLFFPDRHLYDEYKWHPLLSKPGVAAEHTKARQLVDEICRRTGARRVIGKEVLCSLHPLPPMSAKELHSAVTEAFAKARVAASVFASASAVDIAPKGIDKGSGVKWLVSEVSEVFPLHAGEVAGVGDSSGDLPFLNSVGLSAAPANAAQDVKSIVKYRSPNSDGKGVADIIQRCIDLNVGQQ